MNNDDSSKKQLIMLKHEIKGRRNNRLICKTQSGPALVGVFGIGPGGDLGLQSRSKRMVGNSCFRLTSLTISSKNGLKVVCTLGSNKSFHTVIPQYV